MTTASSATSTFDQHFFRAALGRFPTGVTVVTTETASGEPVGLTISSFSSLSLDPALVLWTLALKSMSLPHFRHAQRYVVHVLSAAQHGLARRFASGPQEDRFAGLALARAPGGALRLATDHCAAWFECRSKALHEEGDHAILIGEVEHCHWTAQHPLVYHAGRFDLTPDVETADTP